METKTKQDSHPKTKLKQINLETENKQKAIPREKMKQKILQN